LHNNHPLPPLKKKAKPSYATLDELISLSKARFQHFGDVPKAKKKKTLKKLEMSVEVKVRAVCEHLWIRE
jgi:uncharacterized protein YegJ (DUF2314 family)